MNPPDKTSLEINLNHLEEASQGSPQLLFLWGEQTALAKKEAKLAKNRVKIKGAEVLKAFRMSPEKYGFDKVTEGTCEACVQLDKGYQQLQEALIEAEYQSDVLGEFMDALSDRKDQIGTLSKLHGQMYWSKPNTQEVESTEQQRVAQMSGSSLKRKVKEKL